MLIVNFDESVTKAEKSVRSLPDNAFKLLYSLSNFTENFSKISVDNSELDIRIQRHQEKTIKEFQKREKSCLHSITGLQFRLDAMCAAFEKNKVWRSLVQQRLQEIIPTAENKPQRLLLEIHILKTQRDLVKFGPVEQAKIRLKIELLNAEITTLQKIRNEELRIKNEKLKIKNEECRIRMLFANKINNNVQM